MLRQTSERKNLASNFTEINDKVIIEKIKKKDLKEAISLYDNTYNIKSNIKKALKIFNKINKNKLYHLIVAKYHNEIMGFAMLVISYDIVESCKPFLSVWNFVVKEKYRRKKIGTVMFDYMIKYAKNNECDFISLIAEKNNLAALSFYRKFALKEEVGFVKLIDKESW